MQNVAAEFTIGKKKGVNAEFSIEPNQAIDTIFQINATPDISGLATKEELQETSETINERIDQEIETVNENIDTAVNVLNDRIDTMVQTVEGSELIGVSREGQTVTVKSKTFVFEQGVSSAEWVIVHNLNKYPSIELVDSAGTTFKAQVEYDTLNSCTVYLNGATTGKAYLN